MGQYYHVIVRRNGKDKVYNLQTKTWAKAKANKEQDSWKYYNGLKLMEHSYWRNDFCTAFAETLLDKPARVCWCGDYAEKEECEALGFNYDRVWEKNTVEIKESNFSLDSVKYLINKTKKIYLNLAEYKERSTFDGGWCIFPLSLLTALGNDRGGGDFHEGGTGYEDVGSWAFDEIYISNTLPDGYTEEEYIFIED